MLEHIITDAAESVSTVSKQHEAALKLAFQGIPAFPLIPNAKAPITKTGYKEATTDINAINGWWSKYPDANIGVPTEGLLVLDVDCKNGKDGYAALRKLEADHSPLPPTKTQKTASGGMHYIYRATGIPNKVNCPAPGLDVRGNGGYIVYAPSVIDGSEYVVSDHEIVDAPEWLFRMILDPPKPSNATDPTVTEGSRNDFIFKEAVKLKRQGLKLTEALDKLREINRNECNPPLDDKEVKATVNSAYRNQNGIDAVMLELNAKHAVINIGGKIRIMNHITDPDTGQPDVDFSSPADFRVRYCNRMIEINGQEMSFAFVWLNHLDRKEYSGITFNPVTTPEGYYNLWTGHAVKPVKGDCSKFLAHIRDNIASGNKAVYDYIIAWMAHIVQNPSERIGTTLVMRGAMGTGKGVFANGFGSLFGRHFLPLAQGSQLTGKFNAHMKDKVLLFADESFWAGDKSAEGVLKALITEPFLVIEGKGENAYKIRNHLHFMFATNNEWCVPAGPQERRFFVLDVSEKRMQDHDYFAAIQHELDNGGREALMYHLKNHDVSSINLRKFPQTAALMEQKVYSMTPIQKFVFGKLESGNLSASKQGWDTEIPIKELYGDFIRFCNDLGIRHRPSDAEFGTQLKKLIPGINVAKGRSGRYGISRPNVYRVPTLDDCRADFCKFINYQVEWPVYEEQSQQVAA